MFISDFSDVLKEVFHAEGVLMVRSDERRAEENSLIVRIGIDLFEVVHDSSPLLILGAGQEEDVALHSVYVDSRDYLDIGVGLSCSGEVFFTVMLACFHFN